MAKSSEKVAKSLSFAPKPMHHIWCIEIAYHAPYMVHHGAWTIKKNFREVTFQNSLKCAIACSYVTLQSRARARAILRVNLAKIWYAKVPEKPSRQFPKKRFECTKYGASWRGHNIFQFRSIFGSIFSGSWFLTIFSFGGYTPKPLKTPKTVFNPKIYDERRLSFGVN